MSSDIRKLAETLGQHGTRLRKLEIRPWGKYPAGTSFPASPATGDSFFRTDLGLDCYWDGTYWLTKNEYCWSFSQEVIAASGNAFAASIRGDYFIYLTTIHYSLRIATTNDAGNYWSIHFRFLTGAWGYNTTDLVTDTYDPDEDYDVDQAINAKVVDPAHLATKLPRLLFVTTKTSAPGDVTISGGFYYRLIIP